MATGDKKLVRITGRVIERKTKQGLTGLRVEAMDKDLIVEAPFGSAVTDAQGAFLIEIDKKKIKELFGDRSIVLFFRVFRDETIIASTEESALWARNNPDQEVTIKVRLESAELPDPDNQVIFLVRGQVQRAKGGALTGATVRLFSSVAGLERMLGEAQTDSDGRFEIAYDSGQLMPHADVRLVVRAVDAQGNILASSPAFQMSAEESVSLTVPAEPELFSVRGKVTRDARPVEGRNVQLFGLDSTHQRLLGEATTDGDGIYSIFYDPAEFRLNLPDDARLFLRLFDNQLPVHSPLFRAQAEENFDFKLGGTQTTQFIVQGHLTLRINNDSATDAPAEGRVVRAFSIISNQETPLGSDLSDANGFYSITYAPPQPNVTADTTPQVAVRVFQVVGTQETLVAFAPAFLAQPLVNLDLIIHVVQEPAAFRVQGKITNQNREPLAGFIVQAFDKDLISEQQLGEEAVTGAAGEYNIPYTADQFSRDEIGRADLFLRVFTPARVQVASSESAILFNAPPVATINLSISQELLSGGSEYEQMLVQLAPVLQGLDPAQLLSEHVTFLVGETGIARQRIEFLAEAARLSERTGIVTEAFYGFAREGLSLLLSSLLARSLDELRQKLEAAISSNIIPAALRSQLDDIIARLAELKADQEAQDEIDSVPHQVFGKLLLDRPGGGPLANFKVQGFDAEAADKDLGFSVSNSAGIFTLFYSTPREEPVGGSNLRRFIRLIIFNTQDIQVDQKTVQFTADQGNVLNIPVRVTPAPPTSSPSLSSLITSSPTPIPAALTNFLAGKNITLADVRNAGGLARLPNFPANIASDPAVKFLDAQADLNRISPNLNLNIRLFNNGFTSVFDVASAPRTRVVSFANQELRDFGAGQMHFVSRAQEQFLNNVATAIRVDAANGLDVSDFGVGGTLFPPRCECKDCQAAVSPLAYLADLLAYCLTHITDGEGPIMLNTIENTFFQRFSQLPASCEAMDTLFSQPRLCIGVLRRYINFNNISSTELADAERQYRIEAYKTLLSSIGTSIEEIRLARTADNAQRQALADRLGIALGGPRPDNLDTLLLDPSAITVTPGNPRPLTEDALEQLFGLINTNRNPLLVGFTVLLEGWRLDHLRSLWKSQDFPDDTPGREQSIIDANVSDPADLIGQLRPVIDPDIIGPDDFRHPSAQDSNGPDLPFSLWLKRRQWIDQQIAALSGIKPDLEGMLALMYQPVAYEGTNLAAWATTQPADFDSLADTLSGGANTKPTRIRIRNDLQLTVEAFTRLVEIRTKHTQANDDPRNPRVEEAEWTEAISILVQARKSKFYSTWRDEEQTNEEQTNQVFFGPEEFWISLREPVEGDWPPLISPSQPLIDPETVKLKELPEQTAGGQAIRLWNDRRIRLDKFREVLKSTREGAGFKAMLRLALGHPDPGDELQVDLDDLQTRLNSNDETIANEARATIEGLLFMTVEDFDHLMSVRAKDSSSNPSEKPTAAEYERVYAILTSAQKKKREFQRWVEEEGAASRQYWTLLKAKLPRWRASAEARATWQQSLRIRSSAPIVDPDLIGPGDIKEVFSSDPAFSLWQARRGDVNNFKDAMRNVREHNAPPIDAFDLVFNIAVGIPGGELEALNEQRKSGDGFAGRLNQLSLTNEAFLRLHQLRELVKSAPPSSPDGGLVLSEWDDVYSILTQVHKKRLFAAWREQEKSNLTLSPDHFRFPVVDTTEFPPPPPFEPAKWLGAIRARRVWQDTLQARIDQQASVKEALAAAVSTTEEVCLPLLRDALVNATDAAGSSVQQRAKWLSDRLLIDCSQGGKQKTTLIAQAIDTLQLLLFSLRTGQLEDIYPSLSLDDADDFDEEWEWIGSYATWRAAMFVFMYPENILIPSLKRHRTPAFRNLVSSLRSNSRLTPEQARSIAKVYSDYFRDVCTMTLEASCHAITLVQEKGCGGRSFETSRRLFYVFGRGDETKTAYWSAVDPADDSGHGQTFWQPIPGLKDIVNIIGASVYEKAADQRAIYLFAITQEKGAKKLVFTKYDLLKQTWSAEPEPLELPKEKDRETTNFTAVVKQSSLTTAVSRPPHLAIRLANGALYERRMNEDASDWAEGDWQLLVGSKLYRLFSSLCAMVEIFFDGFYLLTLDENGAVRYRQFSASPKTQAFGEDGYWESLPVGAFKGVVLRPSETVFYVVLEQGAFIRSTIIRRPALTKKSINNLQEFEDWLKAVAGVSLSHYVIDDSSDFDGMTLLQFMKLSLRSPIPAKWAEQRDKYIADITERLIDTEEGQEWKLVDQFVRKFITSIPTPTDSKTVSRTFKELLTSSILFNPVESTRRVMTPGIIPFFPGISGLEQIVPNTGLALTSNLWAYSVNKGRVGVYRTTFTFPANNALTEGGGVRLAPYVTGPFEIADRLAENALQERRFVLDSIFDGNFDGPQSNLDYLEEAYYFVPIHLALQLQSRGQYIAALDLFRTVYDYSRSDELRKIYPGLRFEEFLSTNLTRADDWLRDPLNPHAIAATRKNTYTRFTVLSIIRCLLEFADSEFTRDTSESVARARTLYTTALELLEAPELKPVNERCADLIGSLDIAIEDPQWLPVWNRIRNDLNKISDPVVLSRTSVELRDVMTGTDLLPERLHTASNLVSGRTAQPAPPRLGLVLDEAPRRRAQTNLALQAQPDVAFALGRVGGNVARDFTAGVSLVTGQQPNDLPMIELDWLREPKRLPAFNGGGGFVALNEPPNNSGLLIPFVPSNPVSPSFSDLSNQFHSGALFIHFQNSAKPVCVPVPPPSLHFCIPENPMPPAFRLRAELNLYKLHNGLNIAGLERVLDPYAAPTDAVSGLPTIGAGGQLVLPGLISLPPTPYRYTALIERAKQLVGHAQQIEASMLSALEKRDVEFYNLIKARQDVRLARAGVRLQDIRIREAEDGVELTQLQQERSQIQFDHYGTLLEEPISDLENAGLGFLLFASLFHLESAAVSFSATLKGGPSVFASGVSSLAAAASSTATFLSTLASYERRTQEWQFQQSLAAQDIKIGEQQISLAEDRVRVVGQERVIAQTQLDNAEVITDFLANKFTNVDLYDWMSNILEGVYSFFLQQATSMAQLAAAQLAFERQETTPPFIQDDYWEAPTDTGSLGGDDGRAPDRRGLTGSARLLQDIFQLDQYAFEKNERKLHLTKSISLAQMSPAEFQRFRETGVMRFFTPMELFDQEFPGHYLRLIRRVRTSVVALIPTVAGIRATLSTVGQSRVVIGGPVFQKVAVRRNPETVALSTPRDATGLFELDQQPELLLPFEGMGVEGGWEFRMPRASNRFEFSTIADVILTIEYTALNDFGYRQQVIQSLSPTISADMPFTFRNQFADQWFDLNNPEQTASQIVVRFSTTREDFPPNLEDLKIQQVLLAFVRAAGSSFEVSVSSLSFTENGGGATAGGSANTVDGVISTRRANGASWSSILGKTPFGDWELALPNIQEIRDRFNNEEIADILFVITYSGRTPDWPV
jgi:hypothetical protein